MTLRQTVQALQAQGIQVKYYQRIDRGIVITEINGTKFSGKTGNTFARELTGGTLSTRQAEQLKNIQAIASVKNQPYKARLRAKAPLPTDIERLVKIVQAEFRKNIKAGKRTTVKTYQVRRSLKEEGEMVTRRYLYEAYQYAAGFAYEGNLIGALTQIRDYLLTYEKGQNVNDPKEAAEFVRQRIEEAAAGSFFMKVDRLTILIQEFYEFQKSKRSEYSFDQFYEVLKRELTPIDTQKRTWGQFAGTNVEV